MITACTDQALYTGGLTFFGYTVSIIIGGSIGEEICIFIYKKILPIIIYLFTSMVLLEFISMCLAGEFALTPYKKKKESG